MKKEDWLALAEVVKLMQKDPSLSASVQQELRLYEKAIREVANDKPLFPDKERASEGDDASLRRDRHG